MASNGQNYSYIIHLSQLALNNSRQLNNTKTPEITRKSPIIRQETPKLGKTQNLQGIAYHYTFSTVVAFDFLLLFRVTKNHILPRYIYKVFFTQKSTVTIDFAFIFLVLLMGVFFF